MKDEWPDGFAAAPGWTRLADVAVTTFDAEDTGSLADSEAACACGDDRGRARMSTARLGVEAIND